MQVIADTNVFLAVALNEPEKPHIVQITAGAELFAPEILPDEIGNALSAMVKRQRLSAVQARSALTATRSIRVRLVGVDIAEALQLASDFDLYADDADFLQCARAAPSPLLTMDARMRNLATELKIPLLD
ncbi:MAG: PIN domain-containing protein [Gammaproteobacteria bacterium]|jgi:predicted nucleic acid-binding protein|nr:PIN domain-containing protein [Gammaproteobacteria bacterium]